MSLDNSARLLTGAELWQQFLDAKIMREYRAGSGSTIEVVEPRAWLNPGGEVLSDAMQRIEYALTSEWDEEPFDTLDLAIDDAELILNNLKTLRHLYAQIRQNLCVDTSESLSEEEPADSAEREAWQKAWDDALNCPRYQPLMQAGGEMQGE